MSCFTLSPEKVEQVLWYAQVGELLANMVHQDSHEQDIEDGDSGVCCGLLLLCELGLASIFTLAENGSKKIIVP